MRRRRDGAQRRERGLVAVELAIVLPLLLLLIGSTAELGRLLYQYNALVKANRDGARYAASNAAFGSSGVVVADPSAGSAWTQVCAETASLVACGFTDCSGRTPLLSGLAPQDVTVSSPDPQHVVVSVRYTYQPLFGTALSALGLGSALELDVPLETGMTVRAL